MHPEALLGGGFQENQAFPESRLLSWVGQQGHGGLSAFPLVLEDLGWWLTGESLPSPAASPLPRLWKGKLQS